MIVLAAIYMVFSLIVYLGMFVWLSKPRSTHPEMKEVRTNDPLLVVKFDGTLSTSGPEQHPDLGFAEFLANRDSDPRNHGDS